MALSLGKIAPVSIRVNPNVDPKTAAKVQVVDALTDGTTNPADAVAYLVGAGFSKSEADRIVEAALTGE